MAFSRYVWRVQAYLQSLSHEMNTYLRTPRTTWTEDWLLRRETHSVYFTLVREFRLNNCARFRQFFRVTPEQFDELLSKIRPRLERQDLCRTPVSPEERLAITLRYLATGESRRSLGFAFRVSHNLVCRIVAETTRAIADEMMPQYVKLPDNPVEWRRVSQEFYLKWNYPNCIGAIDGKRVVVQKPDGAGSLYYDYKGHHSILLLAVIDASYRFIYLHVGTPGRGNDAGAWDSCDFCRELEAGMLGLPEAAPLPKSDIVLPYHIVGDDAFPLKEYLMKPYAGEHLPHDSAIFNYRLSRARTTSEDAFGILASRFRVFGKPIHAEPERAVDIVRAAACLHNYLRAKGVLHEDLEVGGGSCLEDLQPHRGRAAQTPKDMRDQLKMYFMTVGKVSWQEEYYLQH